MIQEHQKADGKDNLIYTNDKIAIEDRAILEWQNVSFFAKVQKPSCWSFSKQQDLSIEESTEDQVRGMP